MLDKADIETASRTPLSTDHYDLVVIGAGVAGLNALSAATEYLPKGAKVLLLDQKDQAGGMWNTAYDYVRLHQPHPMFTVGNMRWNWRKPRDYLAARNEVRDHLSCALAPLAKAVDLEVAFGQTTTEVTEIARGNRHAAQITFCPNDAVEQAQTVTADLAIHAAGLNYSVAEPLALSSNNVLSIIPQDLRATLSANPDAPVYVAGGGKTGMDTILAVLDHDARRSVTLINGRGTNFLNRTKYIPTGRERWTGGRLVSQLFRDLAWHFDGENEEDTITWFRQNLSTAPHSKNGVFLYGLQSEEERARIDAGLAGQLNTYLSDVRNGPKGPEMILRDGGTEPIPPGSIIVNCTGSFFRGDHMTAPMEILSPQRTILAINARDAFHFLTSVSGFFLVHLLFRDKLVGRGFYRLDLEGLFRQNRNAWVGASAAHAYLNQVVAVQTLPLMLLDRCGLDLDRWYPLPRRAVGLISMKANAKQDIAHCRKVLDHVADRFGLLAAPLE